MERFPHEVRALADYAPYPTAVDFAWFKPDGIHQEPQLHSLLGRICVERERVTTYYSREKAGGDAKLIPAG